jgi:hypothetical protein
MSPSTRTVITLAATTAILMILLLSHYAWAGKQKIKVTSEKAAIHLWPDSKSRIIGQVSSGIVLNAEYKQGKWFRVNFRLTEDAVIKSGYINQKHIEKLKPKSDKTLVISGKIAIRGKKVTYKGEHLTLRFKNADIRDVIVFLCGIGGLNVVFDPEVSGKISCDLRDVPWDQALDVILKTDRLGKTLEEKVLRIGKIANLIDKR